MASHLNVCWVPETSMPYVNREEACVLEKRGGGVSNMLVLVRVAVAQTEAGAFLFLG